MTAKEAKQIINREIDNWNVKRLIHSVKQRGNADCIEFKERDVENTAEQTALDNFICSVEHHGLKYKGIGVGYDYNAKEHTMVFSYTELNKKQ